MNNDLKTPSYKEGLKELRSNITSMMPAETIAVFDQDADALESTHKAILQRNVGDKVPDFKLPDATGGTVKLSQLLNENKVVLTFYRGNWCPYCNLQLNQYQQILPELTVLGAVLVAISPQSPDESLNMKEKNDLKFHVLSDTGNQVAREFTTVFKNGEAPINKMAELGYDFNAFYEDDAQELPVPTVFIIERDGTISFAKAIGGDYRNRVEPSEIIEALRD